MIPLRASAPPARSLRSPARPYTFIVFFLCGKVLNSIKEQRPTATPLHHSRPRPVPKLFATTQHIASHPASALQQCCTWQRAHCEGWSPTLSTFPPLENTRFQPSTSSTDDTSTRRIPSSVQPISHVWGSCRCQGRLRTQHRTVNGKFSVSWRSLRPLLRPFAQQHAGCNLRHHNTHQNAGSASTDATTASWPQLIRLCDDLQQRMQLCSQVRHRAPLCFSLVFHLISLFSFRQWKDACLRRRLRMTGRCCWIFSILGNPCLLAFGLSSLECVTPDASQPRAHDPRQ
jgi:hypothetical protein